MKRMSVVTWICYWLIPVLCFSGGYFLSEYGGVVALTTGIMLWIVIFPVIGYAIDARKIIEEVKEGETDEN